jgi:pyruvate dehydrogenase E1 component beta subunit
VTREGSDLTIVAYSRTAIEALAAAEELAKSGISAEVIDLRSVVPWDREAVLASAAKTRRLLVAHEAPRSYGIGAEIVAVAQQELWGQLKRPVARIGAPSCAVPFSKPLETAFLTAAPQIAAAARALVDS